MKKLMLLVVIAFALPACGKKNTPPPANAGDTMKKEGDPCAGQPADPCAGQPADPCNPCGGPK